MTSPGCTHLCDFQTAKNGKQIGCKTIVVPVGEVIRDRRGAFEETGDRKHVEFEQAFKREVRKEGRKNPEIRGNYYQEHAVEEGNFISRARLLSCARTGWMNNAILIPLDDPTISLDWARHSDFMWTGLTNRKNDLVALWKYPHVRFERLIERIVGDLKEPITIDGKQIDFFSRITTVRGDSTGLGDFPVE